MRTKGMEAYLDESGISQDDLCVVAGFAGGYGQWRILGDHWDEAVKHLPNRDFHAKTFFRRDPNGKRVGPYKDWSDGDAETFLDNLIDAINATDLHPVGAAVDLSAFNQRTLDERIFLTGGLKTPARWLTSGSPEKPYYLAFQHCVTKAIQYAKSRVRVNFFCDRQTHLAPYALELYEIFKTRNPRRLAHCGTLEYISRLDMRVVQAADLLSHVAYRHRRNPTEESDYALFRLTERENELRFYNEEGIELALHNFEVPKLTMAEMNPQAAERERKRKERLGR